MGVGRPPDVCLDLPPFVRRRGTFGPMRPPFGGRCLGLLLSDPRVLKPLAFRRDLKREPLNDKLAPIEFNDGHRTRRCQLLVNLRLRLYATLFCNCKLSRCALGGQGLRAAFCLHIV